MNRTDIYATLISLNPSHSPLFLHLRFHSQMSFSSLFLFLSCICVLLNCLHVGLSGPIIPHWFMAWMQSNSPCQSLENFTAPPCACTDRLLMTTVIEQDTHTHTSFAEPWHPSPFEPFAWPCSAAQHSNRRQRHPPILH